VVLLSLLGYRRFARTTGLFRDKLISVVIVAGILMLGFACLDNYSRLFFATGVLTVGLVAIITLPQDRPRGYIQRTALGVMGFLLFGYCLGYLGLLANHPSQPGFRPALLLLLIGVLLNGLIGFWAGRFLGGPRFLPQSCPNKTVRGSLAALVLTTILVAWLGHVIFPGTAVDQPGALFILGSGLSFLTQAGEVLLATIRADLGLSPPDQPGRPEAVLDRFGSLVLVPPAFFHYLSLYLGPWNLQGMPERILTGGG
jgi:phosphatidate cytidylyltransferase